MIGRWENLILTGTVSKVEGPKVAVTFPDNRVTGLLPVIETASAFVRITSPITPGDPVIVLAPNGNPDIGLVMRGVWNDTVTRPEGTGETTAVIEIQDGTRIVYDAHAKTVKLTHSSGLEATIGDKKLSIVGDLEIDGAITATKDITSDAEIIDAGGELSRLRTNYNGHTHVGNMGSPTSATDKVDQ